MRSNLIMRAFLVMIGGATLAMWISPAPANDPPLEKSPSENEKSDVFHDPNFFPLAVWLQSPANAAKFREAGVNLYVGLWEGPTEEQLAELKKQKMRVICEQNAVALKHKDDPTIVGWMHGDEPDNARSITRRIKGVFAPSF